MKNLWEKIKIEKQIGKFKWKQLKLCKLICEAIRDDFSPSSASTCV